jgi:hypothetical protein
VLIESENRKINPTWIISLVTVVSLIVILYITENLIGIEDFSDYVSIPLYME